MFFARRKCPLILLLLIAPVCACGATRPVHYGLFGMVHVGVPAGEPERTAIFISDQNGWDARAEAMANAMSADGTLVFGIDLNAYLEQMLSIKDKCSLPSAHVEEMSDWMQRQQNLKNFSYPLLIGDGAGATFAYAIDAQAPKGTFGQLITLGYDFSFHLPKPICSGDVGKISAPNADGSYRIVAVNKLPNLWLPMFGRTHVAPGNRSWLSNQLRVLAEIPPSGASEASPQQRLVAAIAWLTAPTLESAPLPGDVADLPLTEVPAQGKFANRVAVILTGDGGWAGLDIAVADQLAQRGIAVVGLNSVKYFWQTRTPDQATDALARIIGNYAATHPNADFVVLGYSFGAGLAPVLINRLPDAARARIVAQVLISPDEEAVFEIHVGDWFGSTHHEGAIPIKPEITSSKVPVICVHGADEGADSFCSKLVGLSNVRQLELPGGHHYNGDFDKLGASIFSSLPARVE